MDLALVYKRKNSLANQQKIPFLNFIEGANQVHIKPMYLTRTQELKDINFMTTKKYFALSKLSAFRKVALMVSPGVSFVVAVWSSGGLIHFGTS